MNSTWQHDPDPTRAIGEGSIAAVVGEQRCSVGTIFRRLPAPPLWSPRAPESCPIYGPRHQPSGDACTARAVPGLAAEVQRSDAGQLPLGAKP